MDAVYDQWRSALPSEVEFWRELINGERPEKDWFENLQRRIAGEHPFPAHLAPYLNRTGVTRILDVGAGPATCVGTVGAPSPVQILAVDPLAEAYNKLLAEGGFEPVNPTVWAEGENLRTHGWSPFDIVYSRNALDHAYDPLRVIKEMVLVCKPTGAVFFEGHVNEGTNGYGGLHQWNFMPLDNGDLVIWEKENKAVSLRSALGPNATVQAQGNTWYTVEIMPNAQIARSPRTISKRWPPWSRPMVRWVQARASSAWTR